MSEQQATETLDARQASTVVSEMFAERFGVAIPPNAVWALSTRGYLPSMSDLVAEARS